MRTLILGLLGLLALSAEASAQPIAGLYVSGSAGLNLQPRADAPPSPALQAAPRPDPGPAGHAAIGYGLAGSGLPLRLEIEGFGTGNALRPAHP